MSWRTRAWRAGSRGSGRRDSVFSDVFQGAGDAWRIRLFIAESQESIFQESVSCLRPSCISTPVQLPPHPDDQNHQDDSGPGTSVVQTSRCWRVPMSPAAGASMILTAAYNEKRSCDIVAEVTSVNPFP